MDRFDLVVHVARVGAEDYEGDQGLSSAAARARVVKARECQQTRESLNRSLSPRALSGLPIDRSAEQLVRTAVGNGILTARGADRVRRVSRTIADLEGSVQVSEEHVAEAIGLRHEW